MKRDHAATNKVLEAYLILQNNVDNWAKVLEQTAEYHDAVLTPAQKEAIRLALKHSRVLSKRLQRHQAALTA